MWLEFDEGVRGTLLTDGNQKSGYGTPLVSSIGFDKKG